MAKSRRFMPNVSVALATCNGERYLAAQLDSLARQTSHPSELIIADDCSSDESVKLIRNFAAKAAFPVRVIQNTVRVGYRANFMQAAEACSGELIAFCDQDDIWHAEKLGRMRQPFQDPNVLLAYHNSTLIDDAGSAIGTVYRNRRTTKAFGPLNLHPWTIIPGHAQVVRRSLVRFTSLHRHSIDPYCTTEPMPHDQWYPFWASVLGTITYIPECLAQYRQHGANLSGWPHIGWIAYVLDHISNAEKYVSGESLGARNRLELLRRCVGQLHPDEMARVESAISYYQALSKRSDQRLAVYDNPTWRGRARALYTLVRQGDYVGRVSETLGIPALLLDATIGLAFSNYARK